MNANSASRKLLSLIFIIGGIAMLVVSLIMDFSGSGVPYRGALLVCGIIALILGLYLFPTLKYHRRIIYIIFLFPLLFTFAVTVIIPLCLGIFYSFTDWTGIQYTQFVGFGNYISMFQDPQFIWSILITFIFVVINMILVNLIAFLLALLCTNGIKGDGFFRAAYFLPNLIGGIVLGYIWQFVFNNVLINLTKTSFLVQTHCRVYLAVCRLYHASLHHRPYPGPEGCTGSGADRRSKCNSDSVPGQDPDDCFDIHDLYLPDPDVRIQAVRRQPCLDRRYRFRRELHGQVSDKRYADAGS